jgi:predicted transcriptional regulator
MNKYVKFNKDLTLQTIPYIIAYVATLMLIGFGVLVSADFDWTVFQTPMFFFTTGTTAIATILVFLSRFLQKTQGKQRPLYKTVINDEQMTEIEIETDFTKSEKVFSAFAGQDNHDLEEFLKQENRERKIDEWKMRVSERIDKHQSKQKPNDYTALCDGTKNRWVDKLKKLNEQISDEWINKNIDNINIDYDIVTRSLITNGCLIPKSKKRKSRKDYIITKKGAKVFRDIAPKYMMSFAATIFFSVFILDAVKGNVANWTQFAFKLIVLAWNFALGDDYANIFHKEITMNNIQFRLEMIKKYKQWQKQRG